MTLQEFKELCLAQKYPIMTDEGLDKILEYLKPHNHVLEIGTCVGYSSRYLIEHQALSITTLEKDPERAALAKQYLAEFKGIKPLFVDALEFETDDLFDVIILDAAKAQNQRFLDRYLKNLKPEGLIFVDNIFFHGLVDHPESVKQQKNLYKMVIKLKSFVESMKSDERFETEIFEVGDGLMKIKYRDKI